MHANDNVLGCFISFGNESDVPLFKPYIWGKRGICEILKKLKYTDYGIDLFLILFKFYVNPIPYLLENLKEIENYRKKEKAIGIPIIINQDNFFNKSEEERYKFLKESILNKVELLGTIIKKKGLDTNIELLKQDIDRVLI